MSYRYKREPPIQEEATRLAQARKSHDERLVVWTLLDTGLRVGEFSSLSRDNILRDIPQSATKPLLAFHPSGEPSQTLRSANKVMILISESGCVVIESQSHPGNSG